MLSSVGTGSSGTRGTNPQPFRRASALSCKARHIASTFLILGHDVAEGPAFGPSPGRAFSSLPSSSLSVWEPPRQTTPDCPTLSATVFRGRQLLDSSELRQEAQQVIRSYEGSSPPLDPNFTGTSDGRPLKGQWERARAYLSGTLPSEMRCKNTRHNNETGKRSHREVAGTDTLVPASEFGRPWHIWCQPCHKEALRVGWRP
jgi:hypothetical protein